MSARDKDTPNLTIPLGPNHSAATYKNTSFFQIDNMCLSKNEQIDGSSNAPHYDLSENNNSSNTACSSQNTTNLTPLQQQSNRAGNILSLRQPHQSNNPTPLRQHMTNEPLRHASEPIMSVTVSPPQQNNKTTPSASQNPQSASFSTTTAEDPKHQPSNPTANSTTLIKDPNHQPQTHHKHLHPRTQNPHLPTQTFRSSMDRSTLWSRPYTFWTIGSIYRSIYIEVFGLWVEGGGWVCEAYFLAASWSAFEGVEGYGGVNKKKRKEEYGDMQRGRRTEKEKSWIRQVELAEDN
jgi:hypothetical protein